MVISLMLAIGLQAESGPSLINEVEARLRKLHSISVTLTTNYGAAKPKSVERFQAMKGGYLLYQQSEYVAKVSPLASWLIWPAAKQYVRKKAPAKGSRQNPFMGMPGLFGERDMPAMGMAQKVIWYGRPAWKVTIDATKAVNPQAKLAYYFDPKTRLPLGFRLSQGTYLAEGIYSNLKLDPPLKPSDFDFMPPKGWVPGNPKGSH
jgi:hypothetical protein